MLNAVYEVDFRGFSYGFRPGRGPHDALDALSVGIWRKKVNWVLDADIRDFFGQLDRAWLRKFLGHRIADKRVLRLVDKWLAAGVIEDGTWSETPQGSPQGGLCSAEHKPDVHVTVAVKIQTGEVRRVQGQRQDGVAYISSPARISAVSRFSGGANGQAHAGL